jgi:hypothetical protein
VAATTTDLGDLIDRLTEPGAGLDEMGAPLDVERYDWSRAARQPLTDAERFQLQFATQVEWGTEVYFARLDISRDPVVHRFLRIWLAQETVHAQLLARFLAAHGIEAAPAHRSLRQRLAAARGRQVNRLARAMIGDDFSAVHMTWGAVNELTTLRFYGILRARTGNDLLRDILRDVMAQEAVHYSFYRNVAVRRLAGNPRGQRIVRWLMENVWSPVGVGLRSRSDAERLMVDLFRDRPDVVAQMDAQISRIPGLTGLDLARHAVDRALARAA